MNEGIEQALKRLKIEYDTYAYQFTDWERDDAFLDLFSQALAAENHYELVLSVNYSPLIAQVCHDRNVRYAAWIYDSPIHIRREDEMYYDTTMLFCFDRGQVIRFQKKGIRAYHMPLAADAKQFSKYKIAAKDRQQFRAQVSFLGQLYYTDYAYYCGPLGEYERGFLEGVINAQQKIYGAYLIPDLVADDMLKRINEQYAAASDGQASITRRQLEYLLACEVTSRERYLILGLLSNHFQVKHYAPKADERLKNVQYMGYANYDIDMPKIFRLSDINLNITLRSIESGIPLRCLDIMACGGFLISNYQ
ncbi:MAG: DUF3880 domain-containing protein [bacterium]|nr:DUF3880 domain-containing protein [bacterium]